MKNYEIGYYNKPWSKMEWRTLATAINKEIAETIVNAMNKEYEKNGMSFRVIIK